MDASDSSKSVKNFGNKVITWSVLLAVITQIAIPNLGTHGEIGRFAQSTLIPILCLAAWGIATGIGLLRAWRWARISMLIFSSLLVAAGTSSATLVLFMPNGGMSGWRLFLLMTFFVSLYLIPVAVGVRWLIYFTRDKVKAHFRQSRKAPFATSQGNS